MHTTDEPARFERRPWRVAALLWCVVFTLAALALATRPAGVGPRRQRPRLPRPLSAQIQRIVAEAATGKISHREAERRIDAASGIETPPQKRGRARLAAPNAYYNESQLDAIDDALARRQRGELSVGELDQEFSRIDRKFPENKLLQAEKRLRCELDWYTRAAAGGYISESEGDRQINASTSRYLRILEEVQGPLNASSSENGEPSSPTDPASVDPMREIADINRQAARHLRGEISQSEWLEILAEHAERSAQYPPYSSAGTSVSSRLPQ
jgi:hypothetical protein